MREPDGLSHNRPLHHMHKYWDSSFGWDGRYETIFCYHQDCYRYPGLDPDHYPPGKIGPRLYLHEAATEVI